MRRLPTIRAPLLMALSYFISASPALRAQHVGSADPSIQVPDKPGAEAEAAAIAARLKETRGDLKPGLSGKAEMQELQRVMARRLNLTPQQQAQVRDILLDEADAMADGVYEQIKFLNEHGEEIRRLRDQANLAKQTQDRETFETVTRRIEELRASHARTSGLASPYYGGVVRAIEAVLSPDQVKEFRVLADELGFQMDDEIGAKLRPIDYIKVILSPPVALDPKQREEVLTLYRDAALKARNTIDTEEALSKLLGRMRYEIRVRLDMNQWATASQILQRAEERWLEDQDKAPSNDDQFVSKKERRAQRKEDKHAQDDERPSKADAQEPSMDG